MNTPQQPPLQYVKLQELLAAQNPPGAALLMRHAERHPMSDWNGLLAADLTENGWEQARTYGKALAGKYRIVSVAASPVKRCVHTAEAILQGAGLDLPVIQRWWLFSPSLEAEDDTPPSQAVEILSTNSTKELLGRIGYRWLELARRRMTVPSKPGALALYISHDSTVTPMLGYLNGRNTVWVQEYPDYLDGVLLTADGLATIG